MPELLGKRQDKNGRVPVKASSGNLKSLARRSAKKSTPLAVSLTIGSVLMGASFTALGMSTARAEQWYSQSNITSKTAKWNPRESIGAGTVPAVRMEHKYFDSNITNETLKLKIMESKRATIELREPDFPKTRTVNSHADNNHFEPRQEPAPLTHGSPMDQRRDLGGSVGLPITSGNGTITGMQFFDGVLADMNVPTQYWGVDEKFLAVWGKFENAKLLYDGKPWYNPLDTTQSVPGSANCDTAYPDSCSLVVIQVYPNAKKGEYATAITLTNGYYTRIVDGLKTGEGAYYYNTCASEFNTWGTSNPSFLPSEEDPTYVTAAVAYWKRITAPNAN